MPSGVSEWLKRAVQSEVEKRKGADGTEVTTDGQLVDFGGMLLDPMEAVKRTKRSSVQGDAVIRQLFASLRALDKPGVFPRTPMQKDLHLLFTLSAMQLIYRDDYEVKANEIKLLMKVF